MFRLRLGGLSLSNSQIIRSRGFLGRGQSLGGPLLYGRLCYTTQPSAVFASLPPRDAFKFLIDHKDSIDGTYIDTFFAELVSLRNIEAATSLVYLMHGHVFPNETWSAFASEVAAQGSHSGAVVVYHHLVDNYHSYDAGELSGYTQTNPRVPFLLSLGMLESLSAIFARNDPLRARGVLAYFKRFYSYMGHKSTYRALMANVVEAHASAGDREGALNHFKRFAYTVGPPNLPHVIKKQKAAVWTNRVWRNRNIEENNSFKVPEELKTDLDKNLERELEGETQTKEVTSTPYNPMVEHNIYTAPGQRPAPLIKGKVRISDLPVFYERIVRPLVERSLTTADIRYLRELSDSVHPLFRDFVVCSLCELGREKEAATLCKETFQRCMNQRRNIKGNTEE